MLTLQNEKTALKQRNQNLLNDYEKAKEDLRSMDNIMKKM
jgi:hypothetical protein